jgi:hypothetical protein
VYDTVEVSYAGREKSTQIGNARSMRSIEMLAERLLGEIIDEIDGKN